MYPQSITKVLYTNMHVQVIDNQYFKKINCIHLAMNLTITKMVKKLMVKALLHVHDHSGTTTLDVKCTPWDVISNCCTKDVTCTRNTISIAFQTDHSVFLWCLAVNTDTFILYFFHQYRYEIGTTTSVVRRGHFIYRSDRTRRHSFIRTTPPSTPE